MSLSVRSHRFWLPGLEAKLYSAEGRKTAHAFEKVIAIIVILFPEDKAGSNGIINWE